MTIHVYTSPTCKKCADFKGHMHRMGVSYKEHAAEYHMSPHQGWRDDFSVDLKTEYTLTDTLPIILIDNQLFGYSKAMKIIKDRLKLGEAQHGSSESPT